MCSQMLRSRKRNAQRLCAEGKPLFYRRVHRRHTRTRIETKASLDTLGGKLSWFLHPDRNVTESRLGMRCFSLSLWLFLHVLLTQLGGLGEEAAPLSAGREKVSWTKGTRAERVCSFHVYLLIWNTMFDGRVQRECKPHFHEESFADQTQILEGQRVWSSVPVEPKNLQSKA